ncbi:MAG: hypothetical protein HZC16_02280, partial [Candidatus Omnitrophica bacterium]|nr:hypothetical protein [Candidatus Omnitrophota bacterium]
TEQSKFYNFTASKDDQIVIRSRGDFQPLLDLYGPDGKRLTKDETYEEVDKVAPLTGKYTVIISGGIGGGTGKYTLIWQKLNSLCAPYETLTCNKNVTGSLTKTDYFKFFTFTASTNDSVAIRSSMYRVLQLYGPDGKKLAESESAIDQTLPLTGKYTLILYPNNYYGTTTDAYSLIFEFLNNPCSQAIDCGKPVNDSLSSTEQSKFYNFTASKDDQVVITTTGGLTPQLQLYSFDGKKLVEGYEEIEKTVSATAKYTIIVNGGGSSGDYTLNWNRKNNPCK